MIFRRIALASIVEPEVLLDMPGKKVVAMDEVGQEFVQAALHNLIDVEFLEFVGIVKDSTGLNETDGRDFCDDIALFTT